MITRTLTVAVSLLLSSLALAQPSVVEHSPSAQTFGEPAGITQREPEVPREGEAVDLYLRVSFQFTYDRVCIYYTTDGSEPSGAFGTPAGTTQVLRNDLGTVTFVRNENSGGTRDWWRATLPASTRAYAQHIRYKVSAWQQFSGAEAFASGGLTFSYLNKLAWPGAGAGRANPGAGYPPVSFWKEEAVFGNTYCAGMIDQNGSVYDFHFPTVGGVYGVGTKNEGYVDGLDTFPPGLPLEWRGQMHLNQAMPGIRVDGLTHWLSNPNGVSFTDVQQEYLATSNTVRTTARLTGQDITLEQFDFAPIGAPFPLDGGGTAQRHIYLKRLLLTNQGASARQVNVYWYLDPAINGGDTYDGMFHDPARGAMVAFDNTYRVVTGTGTGFTPPNEYNPTTTGGYEKNKSLYLAAAMKTLASPGAPGGAPGFESWRDTSSDNSQGWIGQRVTLPPGGTVEVNFVMAGAADNFAGAIGTYNFQLAPVIEWFQASSIAALQNATDAYWQSWLNAGVTVDTPDDDFDRLMNRGLLTTALHVDAVNGGVIAGFHNGAYPYVWPRDAVYAAVTLARAGHLTEAANVYQWMRDTCYRDFEPWGRKGFWKQKYSTDGYVIWGAPQIDETAVFPWGVHYQYLLTGDTSFLSAHYDAVRDSVLSMTQDSSDTRLRFEDAFNLMYSNNVWEDSYDTFIYSNANVVRGLDAARAIATSLGNGADAADAQSRMNTIKAGLDARLDWDGENTDISQLGIVYPFNVYNPTDFRVTRVIDRINGVRRKFNNAHCCPEPLVNFGGEHQGTINRYWGDNYWNGGPWFLSTLWYGLYYAERQDFTAGTADIDNHKLRIQLCIDRLGPVGLGAEQIAFGTGPGASLLYPGQQDFKLQTAWPNAWESMSTFVDAVMAFIDYRPNAPANTMSFEPKLPSDWDQMTFRGITLAHAPSGLTHRVDVLVSRDAAGLTHEFTNTTGHAVNVLTTLRADTARCIASITRDGSPLGGWSVDPATGRITLSLGALDTGVGEVTTIRLNYVTVGSADFDGDGDSGTDADIEAFFACLGGDCCATCGTSDFDNDGDAGTDADIEAFFRVLGGAPC